MALEHIRNLVFEGGGVRGIAYVGALRVLQEQGVMNNVKRFCGTSAGAITAWLVSYYNNYDLGEIEEIQKETKFEKFTDDDWGIFRDTYRLLNQFGWHKGEKFYQWAQKITRRRFNKDHITFKELFEKTGHELLVIGCNLSKGKPVLFSKDNTPDLYVERALRISMSIPIFFRAVFIEDKYINPAGNIKNNPGIDKDIDTGRDVFVDGGLLDNYPIQSFDVPPYVDNKLEGEVVVDTLDRKPPYCNKSTLGFRLDTPAELEIGRIKEDKEEEKATNLFNYVFALFDIALTYANKRHLDDYDWKRTIQINTLDIKTTQFDLKEEDQHNLIAQGRKATEDYLKKIQ